MNMPMQMSATCTTKLYEVIGSKKRTMNTITFSSLEECIRAHKVS